jgi:hypothetical protein
MMTVCYDTIPSLALRASEILALPERMCRAMKDSSRHKFSYSGENGGRRVECAVGAFPLTFRSATPSAAAVSFPALAWALR